MLTKHQNTGAVLRSNAPAKWFGGVGAEDYERDRRGIRRVKALTNDLPDPASKPSGAAVAVTGGFVVGSVSEVAGGPGANARR